MRSVTAKLFIFWMWAHGALGEPAPVAGTPAQAKSFCGGNRATEFAGVSALFGSVAECKC